MEAYKIRQTVNIPQEELTKWLNSPLTKALMRNINEYNEKNVPSIFIAVQWDTENDNATIHFAVMPH